MDYWLTIVGISVVLNLIGGLIYGVFGAFWVNALGKSSEELRSRPNNWVAYLFSFFRSITITVVVDFYLHQLKLTGDLQGALVTFSILAVGFSVGPVVNHHIFPSGLGNGLKLSLVDCGYDLVSIVLAAAGLVLLAH